jgi:hypothetical protein
LESWGLIHFDYIRVVSALYTMKNENRELLKEAAGLISSDLQTPISMQDWDEEALVRYLTPLVRGMLDRDFNRFLQVCYRVDIGEQKLKTILAEAPPETLAETLARELVARQVQKILLRRKYSGH